MLWTCDNCGCLGIAASLEVCPMCGKEREVPKATVDSGASNAAADAEAAAAQTGEEPAADAPPADDTELKTFAELEQEAPTPQTVTAGGTASNESEATGT